MKLNPQKIAEKINWPLDRWPGNCFGIASAMIDAKIVRGKAIYGHYHGYIHPESRFGGRRFTHHGWIACAQNKLIDPTRWVFECADPYIYVGLTTDPDYDAGGNRLRMQMLKPPPAFNPKQNKFTLPKELAAFGKLVLGHPKDTISIEQLMWLANLPLNMMGEMAEPLFRWIVEEVELPGLIPIDNRRTILGK